MDIHRQGGEYSSPVSLLSLSYTCFKFLYRWPGSILAPGHFSASSCPGLICRMWHKIANQLAERYTVVIPDLRGMSSPSVEYLHFERDSYLGAVRQQARPKRMSEPRRMKGG